MKTKLSAAFITLALTSPVLAIQLPNDAEVATEMVTINRNEIKLSRLAEARATDPKVRDFAHKMVFDHEKNRDTNLALSKKINLETKDTQASNDLRDNTKKEYEKLAKLKGKDFDKTYMNVMIEDHKQAWRKLDQALVPYAKNPELKAMLQKNQSKVKSHWEHAEKISASL